MASLKPVVIKNGEFQQLQATDDLIANGLKTFASGCVSMGAPRDLGVNIMTINTSNTTINQYGNLDIATTDAQGIDIGGQLTLGGHISGIIVPFASIAGRKANSTSGDALGYFQFGVTRSDGTMIERMRLMTGLNIGGTSDPGAGNLWVLNGSGNNNLVIQAGSGSTVFKMLTLADNANCRNWSFRNRYNAYGTLELMMSSSNTGDPLTTVATWYPSGGLTLGPYNGADPGANSLIITNGTLSGLANLIVQPYSGNSTSGTITSMTIAPANGVNGSTAQFPGAASAISFGGVFSNYSPDQATRLSARIRSGFFDGTWATEYLAFDVGTSGGGPFIERARFTGSGGLNIGGTNDVAAGSIYLKGSPEPYITFYTTDSGYNGEPARFVAGSNGGSWNQGVLVLQAHPANTSAWGNIQKWFSSGGVIIGAGNTDPGAYSLVVEGQVRLNKQNQNALAYMNNAGAQAFAILRSLNSNDANDIQFYDVTNSIIRMTIGATGGVNIGGGNADPGAGNLSVGNAGTGTNVGVVTINGGSGLGGGGQVNLATAGTVTIAFGSERSVAGGTGSSTKCTLYAASSLYRLYGAGAGTLTTDASGNIIVSSDETLKIIEGDFERGMADLRGLKPKKGHWTEDSGFDTSEAYVWLTAQDLLPHIPEAIFLGLDDKYTVDRGPILHTIINALNEIDARLARLEGVDAPKPDKTDRKKLAADRIDGLKQRQIERKKNHRKL